MSTWSAPVRYAECDGQGVVFNSHYLLYADGQAVGVVEAKRVGETLTGVELQGPNGGELLPRARQQVDERETDAAHVHLAPSPEDTIFGGDLRALVYTRVIEERHGVGEEAGELALEALSTRAVGVADDRVGEVDVAEQEAGVVDAREVVDLVVQVELVEGHLERPRRPAAHRAGHGDRVDAALGRVLRIGAVLAPEVLGRPGRDHPVERHRENGTGTRIGGKRLGPGAYFNSKVQALVRQYYEAHPASGGAANWKIGDPVPPRATLTGVPDGLRAALPAARIDHAPGVARRAVGEAHGDPVGLAEHRGDRALDGLGQERELGVRRPGLGQQPADVFSGGLAQLTGQPKFPIFPLSEVEFEWRVVEALSGNAVEIVLELGDPWPWPALVTQRIRLAPDRLRLELTLALPPKVTAATGMDALTHNMEAFIAKNYHPLSAGIALEAAREGPPAFEGVVSRSWC